jgi:hypothetical protein
MQEFSHASRIGALPGKTRFIPLHAGEFDSIRERRVVRVHVSMTESL